jgi:hypothetical protein
MMQGQTRATEVADMAKQTSASTSSGSALTRAEMHAYYIAVVTMPRLVFHREQLDPRA